jgi:hypothetical protein
MGMKFKCQTCGGSGIAAYEMGGHECHEPCPECNEGWQMLGVEDNMGRERQRDNMGRFVKSNTGQCSVYECNRNAQINGLCRRHYNMKRRDMLKKTWFDKSMIDRFLEKIMPVTESGCWIWLGSTTKDGYGRAWINGKMTTAHRFSYEHFNEPIPVGMFALHKCDTPSCVNPNHIFIGTRSDNMKDSIRKGRNEFPHECVSSSEYKSHAPYCIKCGRFMKLMPWEGK